MGPLRAGQTPRRPSHPMGSPQVRLIEFTAMRRCLIATFLLHFFLSMGLFAIGKIDTAGVHQTGDSSNTALFAGSEHPAQKDGLMGAAPDHALTDGQADLPEETAVSVEWPRTAPAALYPAPPPSVKLIYPVIEGPMRPPKRAPLTA
jgi:hypothetical protein